PRLKLGPGRPHDRSTVSLDGELEDGRLPDHVLHSVDELVACQPTVVATEIAPASDEERRKRVWVGNGAGRKVGQVAHQLFHRCPFMAPIDEKKMQHGEL